jgi:Raf kinase inhibitor-like YbhB/YbcL family protein
VLRPAAAAWALLAAAAALAGCASTEDHDLPDLPKLSVTSSAYAEGAAIPKEFSCDGADRSPPLSIAGAPAGARYYALVFDDPDAPRGTWTHWTFWDLPVARGTLPAGADVKALGAKEGTTSSKSVGYHGPCPPGGTHRYVAHAFATNEPLGLQPGAGVDQVWKAVQAKAVAQGTLTGRYSR